MVNQVSGYGKTNFNPSEIPLPPRIDISPNPAHKTNEKLDLLIEQFESTYNSITSLNKLAIQMSVQNAQNAKSTNFANNILISIGLGAILLSTIISGYSLYDSITTGKNTDTLLQNITKQGDAVTNTIESSVRQTTVYNSEIKTLTSEMLEAQKEYLVKLNDLLESNSIGKESIIVEEKNNWSNRQPKSPNP